MKRFWDIVISFLLILLLTPLMLILFLILLIDDGLPVIFRQERVGRGGKIFKILKFRTMKKSSPNNVSKADLQNPYSYMTRCGKFLRASSLDELPQLFNILKGDMSLVGPRPLIVRERALHILRMDNGVYTVRPGLTGWAQVNGRDCINIVEKVKFDKIYVEKRSCWFDLKIIGMTLFVAFQRDGYREGKPAAKSQEVSEEVPPTPAEANRYASSE